MRYCTQKMHHGKTKKENAKKTGDPFSPTVNQHEKTTSFERNFHAMDDCNIQHLTIRLLEFFCLLICRNSQDLILNTSQNRFTKTQPTLSCLLNTLFINFHTFKLILFLPVFQHAISYSSLYIILYMMGAQFPEHSLQNDELVELSM